MSLDQFEANESMHKFHDQAKMKPSHISTQQASIPSIKKAKSLYNTNINTKQAYSKLNNNYENNPYQNDQQPMSKYSSQIVAQTPYQDSFKKFIDYHSNQPSKSSLFKNMKHIEESTNEIQRKPFAKSLLTNMAGLQKQKGQLKWQSKSTNAFCSNSDKFKLSSKMNHLKEVSLNSRKYISKSFNRSSKSFFALAQYDHENQRIGQNAQGNQFGTTQNYEAQWNGVSNQYCEDKNQQNVNYNKCTQNKQLNDSRQSLSQDENFKKIENESEPYQELTNFQNEYSKSMNSSYKIDDQVQQQIGGPLTNQKCLSLSLSDSPVQIDNMIATKQNHEYKTSQFISQLAQLNLSSSSGSNDFQDSPYVQPSIMNRAKNKKKRLRKKPKQRKQTQVFEEKQIQSIVMTLDFLEDEDVVQQITPRHYSKPLNESLAYSFNSKDLAHKDIITSQCQMSDHSLDDQIEINQSIHMNEYNEKLESEVEFLTQDQVQNFDNLFTFKNDLDNDSAKLNVSLKSSQENKILQQNGGDLTQLKSSPMMRSKTYRAPSISPPCIQKSKDHSEDEELTHNEIILKLLAKLQTEKMSPTKLKVQQNLQRNVNFYDDQDINLRQRRDQTSLFNFNHNDIYNLNIQDQNLPFQHQLGQPQQPFSFQLNPCFEMPLQHISNQAQPLQTNIGPMNVGVQMNMMPNRLNGQYGLFNMNNDQSYQQRGQTINGIHINQGMDQLQIQHQLNDLVFQQQTQLNTLASMYNMGAQPPLLTDLDNQMQSLPLQFQYALVTDESYLQRQFQISQLLKQQQAISMPMNIQQPNGQFQFNQNCYNNQQQTTINPINMFMNHATMANIPNILQPQPMHMQQPLINQPYIAQNNYFNGMNFNQMIHRNQQLLNQGQFNSQKGSHMNQKDKQLNDMMAKAKLNRHMVGFQEKMAPIGYNVKANMGHYPVNKSAFQVTPKFINKFMKQDDSTDGSNSQDQSPSKQYGSPDPHGKTQSIFSEQAYQASSSPRKQTNAKQKGNRLLQMTMNINQMYDKVSKYKRARQKCLESIRNNKPQVDYIKTKSDKAVELGLNVHPNQFVDHMHSNQPNDIILQNNTQQQDQNKLSLYTQEHSFGGGPNAINSILSANGINDYSGLSKNDNLIIHDDDLFEEKLKWDRKNSMRQQRDQNEEIGLGSGGEYVLKENQIIISPENEKYKIVQYLGQGTFGQVVKCINVRKGTQHAVKIIKNKTEFMLQGMVEIKILEKLNDTGCRTEFEKQHLIKMEDYFVFRDYLCLVFELLQSSLYETIQETERGLSLSKVREYTRQILESLVTCKESNLIHCDLKPENILTAKDGLNVKLIDFGSATFNGHQVYTYIQSRYYRAPEVLMGCHKYPPSSFFGPHFNTHPIPLYDQSIDMWSLGCTAIEMLIKIPIFPGKYDYDQLLKILEFCGTPHQHMILNSQNRDRFFYYNPQEQRHVFKTFYDFVMTIVPPNMQDKVEQPMNYHQHYDFRTLLEQHYLMQLKRDKNEIHMKNQREIAADTKNHCFIPYMFEYTFEEKLQIDQFIDFVEQILQIDPSKRLTPLQALSHPFITGINLPLPYVPHSEIQLKRFRQANLVSSQDDHQSSKADFEFHMNSRNDIPLPISESQRSISAPLPKRFSVWEFFKKVEQKNGTESYRPPIYALPENIFYGNCCETTISEFYQESKIRFQLHQDENNLAQINLQRQLLQNHKFCDIDFNNLQQKEQLFPKLMESQGSDDYDQKSNISVLEIQRQKSILQIKEDKNIKQPKVTESENFIRELLQRDVINFVSMEADRRYQSRIKEEQKQVDSDFQFIDDYFRDSHQPKLAQGFKVVKNWENNNKQQFNRAQSSFDLFEDTHTFLNQSRKGLLLIKKDKERSNSSDTIQKQQSQQPEISLFSKNPIIQEEMHGSKDDISSPISSIKSDQYCNSNSNIQDHLKSNSKFKSQIQQSAASQIQKHQNQDKPLIKVSKFAENILDQSSTQLIPETNKNKRSKRKKKKKLSHLKTPVKHEEGYGFGEFEEHSVDEKNHFGSSNIVEGPQKGCHSHCEPFSNHFSKKSSSAFADPECDRSHSGSDFDTEHDTDYGKHEYKKGSDNNECCLTNFKGSTSLRNNTFSNNNSFENPDYLDQLSGSIKGIANNNGAEDEQSGEIGGIRCLRSKRSVKKNKKRKN